MNAVLARLWRSHFRTAGAAALGAGIGAAYAHFAGCQSGTCALTSNAWHAALYGALTGAVVGWPSRSAPGAPAARSPNPEA